MVKNKNNKLLLHIIIVLIIALIVIDANSIVKADTIDEINWEEEKQLAEKELNTPAEELGYVPGEVMLCFKEGTSVDEIRSIVEKHGGQLGGINDDGSLIDTEGKSVCLVLFSDMTVETAIKVYKSESKVYYAEKNYIDSPDIVGSAYYYFAYEDDKRCVYNEFGCRVMNGTPVVDGIKYYLVNGEFQTGWLDLGNWKMYFDPVTFEGAKGIREINGKMYLFNNDGIVLKNGTPVINGEKYYCSSTGELKTGWLYLTNWKMFFDPESFAAAVGFKEINGKMYLFNKDGVIQNYAGTTMINVNGETNKYWFSTDDASLKFGWLTLGNMKLYFDPDTYAAYTNGTYLIDGQKYTFNSDGVAV